MIIGPCNSKQKDFCFREDFPLGEFNKGHSKLIKTNFKEKIGTNENKDGNKMKVQECFVFASFFENWWIRVLWKLLISMNNFFSLQWTGEETGLRVLARVVSNLSPMLEIHVGRF